MSPGSLARAAVLASIAVSVQAGEIRGRVLVDGKPAASVEIVVLPVSNGFEEAGREARREDPPAPLAVGTTRADGRFVVAVTAPAGRSLRVLVSGGAAAPRPGRRGTGATPGRID